MTSSSEGEARSCPVCKTHPTAEVHGAVGMVLTAAEALVKGHDDQVIAAYENAQPYDFHIAVTMFVETLANLADYACVDLEELLAENRNQLRDLQQNGS